ncbi:hypothetical protein K461DRAFT_213205, partial [Myriangium duriaei CBS 260.36]
MPHYLHPRSRSTSTLFTGCLAVSFLVVGMPHLLPCPVDCRQFTDSGEAIPKARRQRRKPSDDPQGQIEEQSTLTGIEAQPHRNQCPVPKPRGLIGQMLGFKEDADRD